MLRPAHLLSTAVLVAIAAIQLQDAAPAIDRTSAAAVPKQNYTLTTHRLSAPAQTISSKEISKPVQSQRWVF